ncbi:hypothetical protein DSECCO2_465100 [anaerobic digester metagenome]
MSSVLDLLLEQSKRDLDFRVKIVEEETKKAGLLLAAIGVLLTILFNLLLTQQEIFSNNLTIPTPPTPYVIDPNLFSFFFDYHLIIGEALLLLLSAVCFVVVLISSSRTRRNWSLLDNKEWRGTNPFAFQVANFQNALIDANMQSIRDFDESIVNLNRWSYMGTVSILFSIAYIIIIFILILIRTSSDAILLLVLLTVGAISVIVVIVLVAVKVIKFIGSQYNSWIERRKRKIITQ